MDGASCKTAKEKETEWVEQQLHHVMARSRHNRGIYTTIKACKLRAKLALVNEYNANRYLAKEISEKWAWVLPISATKDSSSELLYYTWHCAVVVALVIHLYWTKIISINALNVSLRTVCSWASFQQPVNKMSNLSFSCTFLGICFRPEMWFCHRYPLQNRQSCPECQCARWGIQWNWDTFRSCSCHGPTYSSLSTATHTL